MQGDKRSLRRNRAGLSLFRVQAYHSMRFLSKKSGMRQSQTPGKLPKLRELPKPPAVCFIGRESSTTQNITIVNKQRVKSDHPTGARELLNSAIQERNSY